MASTLRTTRHPSGLDGRSITQAAVPVPYAGGTYTLDWSTHTGAGYAYQYSAGYQGNTTEYGNAYDYGSGESASWSDYSAVTVKFGSGDDNFTTYGAGTLLTLTGNGGTDTFTASWSDSTSAISFALAANGATSTFNGQGTKLTGFEIVHLTTGAGNDSLTGGDNDDELHGSGGTNTLKGGAGDDTLYSDAGGIDTIDGGAGDADRWYADYSTTSAGLTISHGIGSGYTLSSGGSIKNVERFESVQLGSGNDTVTIGGELVYANINGGDGSNTLTIDHSADTGNSYFNNYSADYYGYFYGSGSFNGYTTSVNETKFGVISLAFGSGDDGFATYGIQTVATVDGGAGTDRFTADFTSSTSAISFALATSGAASTFNGQGSTVTHFESVDVATGAGNDTLTGGANDDTLHGGAGTNTLNGGDGNDTIYSDPAAIDAVDGGAGETDRWYADYSASTAAITITHGADGGYALSNGGTIKNVERFENVQLGSGDDTVTIGSDLIYANIDGGDGSNAITIDRSADTGNSYFNNYASDYYAYDYGSGAFNGYTSSINESKFHALSLTFGSGDDTFATYGIQTVATVDGGAGTDRFTGDFSSSTSAISFALTTSGTASTFNGQGSRITHFESVDITTGAGNDSLTGGAADDTLHGGAGTNTLKGGDGNDTIYSDPAATDTVDGGAGDSDQWSIDYSASTTGITISHGVGSSYTLSNGGTVKNVERFENVQLGSGNDTATLGGELVYANINGGDGSNTLTIDHSSDTGNSSFNNYSADYYGYFSGSGSFNGYTTSVNEARFGVLSLTFGSGDDSFNTHGIQTVVTVDGGAGDDRFTANFSGSTSAISFALAIDGSASTFSGQGSTISHFESVDLTAGAGNDSLTGGAADDTLHGGAGANTLNGGDGNDTIYSDPAAVDTIDGGAGDTDRWYADYSATTTALTLSHGAGGSYTLSNGDSIKNVERFEDVNLGTGNDTATLGNDLSYASLDGGAGTNTLTIDHSADTGYGYFYNYSADYNGYQYGTGSFNGYTSSISETNFTKLALSFGAGDDVYYGYGSQAVTVNGGGGADTFYGGAGNDTFDGGNGSDTAYLDGNASDYTVKTVGGVTTVKDNRTGTGNQDGTDKLTHIEYLHFADQTVTISTDHAPVAAADSYSGAEDTTLTVTAANGVLKNDSDQDSGDTLSAVLASGPNYGTLTLNANGSFSYTPVANFNGSDTFSYRASDSSGFLSDPVTVTINLAAVNDAPVAQADSYNGYEDVQLNIAASGVLANDDDHEDDPITAVLVSGPAHGTLTLNSNGSFGYQGAQDYNGTDSFTYKAKDLSGAFSDPVTVAINLAAVNDAPVARADTYAPGEDTALNVSAASGVLKNDTDVDGDTLTAVLKTGPSHGTLTLAADGSFVYAAAANYNGADSFTYQAKDPSGSISSVVTVTLNVAPVNDAPVAVADSYAATEDTTLTVTAANGVLKNDTDLEGDPLTAVLKTGPAHGTVALNANGSFTYTGAADYNGADSFTYQAKDPSGALSSPVTVSLSVAGVNDYPTGVADSYAGTENTSLTVSAANGVLKNDSDIDGDQITADLVNSPKHGQITLNADGSFVYTPGTGFNGTDGFDYLVKDPSGQGVQTHVTLMISGVNDAPHAVADRYDVDEDVDFNVTTANGVLKNDSDPEDDSLTAVLVSGPAHGTLTLKPGGAFSYRGSPDYNGSDSFTYQAKDPSGALSAPQTVFLTVRPTEDRPDAVDDAGYTTTAGKPIVVNAAHGVLANDTDKDVEALSAVLGNGPAHGSVTLNADGAFTYTPDAGFGGTDTFTYYAKDAPGFLSATPATVSILVDAAVTITGTGGDDTIDPGHTLPGQPLPTGSADTLYGLDGNDTLDGGLGADTMVGGKGNDTYVVENSGDVVVEKNGEGTDTVRSSISYSFAGQYLETLVLTGSDAIDGTGNSYANTITGNDAANTLDGGTGADALTGGKGADTYIVDNAGDVVTELTGGGIDTVRSSITFTLGSELENLVLTGTAAINGTGNGVANTLTGNSGVNTLTGGDGNDTIDGGAGADVLVGGKGDDTFVVDNAGDTITERNGEGTDLVLSSVSFSLGGSYAENITLTGTDAVNATGNGLANTLIGNGGANVLDGGSGADILTGGAGNDTYYVDSASDVVVEKNGEGTDTVISSITYSLAGRYVENITLSGSANIGATGNSLANILIGNDGNNTLDGSSGADTMTGGKGDDTYIVDNMADVVVEKNGGGTDLVKAQVSYSLVGSYIENLTLAGSNTDIDGTGNTLGNILNGSSGDNRLEGGAGADTLYGGQGTDRFVYHGATDSTAAAFDTITDFHPSQHDIIDLTLFDADTTTAGRQAFHFIGTAAFDGHAGELRMESGSGVTYLLGYTDADSNVDFKVALTGTMALTAADFAGVV